MKCVAGGAGAQRPHGRTYLDPPPAWCGPRVMTLVRPCCWTESWCHYVQHWTHRGRHLRGEMKKEGDVSDRNERGRVGCVLRVGTVVRVCVWGTVSCFFFTWLTVGADSAAAGRLSTVGRRVGWRVGRRRLGTIKAGAAVGTPTEGIRQRGWVAHRLGWRLRLDKKKAH